MQSVLQVIRDSINSAQDQAKTYVDKRQQAITFNKGDMVYLKVLAQLETLKMGKCKKLSPPRYP